MAAVVTFVFICFAMAGFAGIVVNSSVRFEGCKIGIKYIMIFIYQETIETSDDI
jgi:hypothetical protein